MKKNSPAGTTLYAWSTDRIIGEYNSNGTAKSETVYLNDIPVGLLKDGKKHRIYADQIDTPRLITTESNQPLWRWDSKPFGESEPNEDVDQYGQNLTYNLRFPGQYFDAETQTHYNYRRDYNPKTGRYLQSDPIGIEGGVNSYGYVVNSPLLGRDPRGELFGAFVACEVANVAFSAFDITTDFLALEQNRQINEIDLINDENADIAIEDIDSDFISRELIKEDIQREVFSNVLENTNTFESLKSAGQEAAIRAGLCGAALLLPF